MRIRHVVVFSVLPILGLWSCKGEDGKRDSSSGSSNIDLIFSSSQLGLASLSPVLGGQFLASEACQLSLGSQTVQGVCTTPLGMSGSFNAARLYNPVGGSVPVRLLGGGNESGLEAVFKYAAFDLSTTPTIDGDDNIQDGSASATYTSMYLTAQYLEYAFTATPDSKVYRVRTFFASSKPSDEEAFQASGCRVSSSLGEADSIGTLFADLEAQAGDILVCVKNSADATCADTDFQWVASDGTLSSTRPATPKQQSSGALFTESSCSSDTDWGYAKINIAFPEAISISAAFGDGGVKTYTVDGSSGTKLNFKIDIDLENALFVPSSSGISDFALANEPAILNNISDILPKSFYIAKHQTVFSEGDTSTMLQGTPELTVE